MNRRKMANTGNLYLTVSEVRTFSSWSDAPVNAEDVALALLFSRSMANGSLREAKVRSQMSAHAVRGNSRQY